MPAGLWLTVVPRNRTLVIYIVNGRNPVMPKSGSRRTSAPELKRPVKGPTAFGLPEDSSFRKFLVERDLQRRIRNDRSAEPRIVVRDEV